MKTQFKDSDFTRSSNAGGKIVYKQEASTLGLEPGSWPEAIMVEIQGHNQAFDRGQPIMDGDKLFAVTYTSPEDSVTELLIFND